MDNKIVTDAAQKVAQVPQLQQQQQAQARPSWAESMYAQQQAVQNRGTRDSVVDVPKPQTEPSWAGSMQAQQQAVQNSGKRGPRP